MTRHATHERPQWEYHTIIREKPLTDEELADLDALGWEAYSRIPPVSADSQQYSYHFRRPVVISLKQAGE
jgi:hypothetical protein